MSIDIIIIGAGPAGMLAAITATESGAKVLLLDDQPTPGGQIYRAIEAAGDKQATILGPEYMAGKPLAQNMRSTNIEYVADASVWQVTDEREVGYSSNGQARLVTAPAIILATGAIERPFPIKGWTLPGVMMAGAAQTMLKTSGLAAEGAIFAGCGPLLYLVAHQYLQAGVKIAAIVDTTAKANRLKALPHIPGALRRWDLLSKGQKWQSEIRKSGTRIINNVRALKVLGDTKAEGLSVNAGGTWQNIPSDHIFLHQGVVPNVNLSFAASLDHDWDEQQLCWRPKTDQWCGTSIDGVYVAGDGGGIGGGLAARASGEIAALGSLAKLGLIDTAARDSKAKTARTTLRRELSIRPFLDTWFRPSDDFRVPTDDDAIICRCEELSLKDIRDTIEIGLVGPNQLKSFCRAGMGPCQGRFCGLTVQELIAKQTNRPAADVGYYRLRPPIKPLRLEELANLQIEEDENIKF